MTNPYRSRSVQQCAVNLDTSLERYRYFIKSIVEKRCVWGLYHDGWAIGATSYGRNSLPVWADKTFAKLCQTEVWAKYQPAEMTLDSFIFKVLPYAAKEKVLLSIMMTPEGRSVFLEPSKVLMDLKNYLYEIYTKSPEFFKAHPDIPLPRKIRIHAI